MIYCEYAEVKISKQNRKHYQSLGYVDIYNGCNVAVKVNDIPKSSSTKIKIKCDYCGNVFDRTYKNHILQVKKAIVLKDSCSKCVGIKRKESNLIVYGVENTAQLDYVRDKMVQTIMDRYGVEHQMYLDTVKNKIKNTNIERYGFENPTKAESVKQKTRNTNLERYGVAHYTQTEEYKIKNEKTNITRYGFPNPFQNQEVKEKQRATILEKYGCENVFQNEEIKEKSKSTMLRRYGVDSPMKDDGIKRKVFLKMSLTRYLNGTVATSKQQKYIHNLIGGELNYPVDHIVLDIAFPKEMIYVEYDGGGHDLGVKAGQVSIDTFRIKEIKRYKYLKSLGWREIRIQSPRDWIPCDTVILSEIEKAKQWLKESDAKGHYHYNITLGSKKDDPNYGVLRKI